MPLRRCHTGGVRYRWLNPHQPQTLQISVFLLYFTAVITILGNPRYLLLGVLEGVGGFGIANEKKWGYITAIAAAVLDFVVTLRFTIAVNFAGLTIIGLMFSAALVALLLHPQSREYQKIWFQ